MGAQPQDAPATTVPAWRKQLESTLLAEVSSRSLGLLRIFTAVVIYIEFCSPWVAHRQDDHVGTWLFAWGVLLCAWFVAFGFKTRPAAIVMALCFGGMHLYYGIHLDMPAYQGDVREFQLCVLLALTPCGRSLSIDRAIEVKRARAEGRAPPPERIYWWQLELFILQMVSVYFWIGYDGLDPQWLDGTTLELHFIHVYARSDAFVAYPHYHQFWVAFAWIATILEFAFALGLLVRRTRPYVMWVALVYLFVHLELFSRGWGSANQFMLYMILLIACLEPAWVHALVSYQAPAKRSAPTPSPDPGAP